MKCQNQLFTKMYSSLNKMYSLIVCQNRFRVIRNEWLPTIGHPLLFRRLKRLVETVENRFWTLIEMNSELVIDSFFLLVIVSLVGLCSSIAKY